MNDANQNETPLERRLRRTVGSLDVSADFSLRLGAELATLGRGADGSRAALRAQLAAERKRALDRLRAQLCWSLVMTLTAGVVAAAFAWSIGTATGGAFAAFSAHADWTLIGIGSAVTVLVSVFVLSRRPLGGWQLGLG
jgi:hypothetical protein